MEPWVDPRDEYDPPPVSRYWRRSKPISERVRAVNSIQEAPSTSLTGAARDVYLAAKQRVATWDPHPPPKEET